VPTDDVAVSETLAGIRRQAARQGQTPRKKVAATAAILRQIVAPIPADLRDRALLLVGFAGALCRSELAPIRVEQLETTERGLRLTLPQTKGSQTDAVIIPPALRSDRTRPGARAHRLARRRRPHRRAGLPPDLDPHEAQARRAPARPRLGAQPITPWAVAAIVKGRAQDAGFGGRDFGGHSLKRGALTTGMDRGEHPAKLKRLGRHKSFDVLGEYLEFGDLFEGHPLTGVL
jgi:hypothetical protein